MTRSNATKHQQSSGLILVSQILVLLASLWINAFDYMLLARMVRFFVPSHNLFRIKASTFALMLMSLDVISFIIQLVGEAQAGLGASEQQQLKGIYIYMGGIGLQEFFIMGFVDLAIKILYGDVEE